MKRILSVLFLTAIVLSNTDAQYLPLSGGTMTGGLTITGTGGAYPYPNLLTVNYGNIVASSNAFFKSYQMYMQGTSSSYNGHVRGVFSQNVYWDESTGQWYIGNVSNPDFSAVRMENAGQMAFYTHPYDTTGYSGSYMQDSNMQKYRRLTITNTGNIGIGTASPSYQFMTSGQTGRVAAFANDAAATAQAYASVANRVFFGYNGTTNNAVVQGLSGKGIEFNVNNNTFGSGNAVTITSTGLVGIGTTTPSSSIEISNGTSSGIELTKTGTNAGTGTIYNDGALNINAPGTFFQKAGNGSSNFSFFATNYNFINASNVVTNHIDNNGVSYFNGGNVGIGTANPQSLLAVNGTITTKQVVVTQTGWSDFVFKPSYKLRSLPAVEAFIKQNGHLPDVPSATEVAKKGVDVAGTQAVLLQKIEELTLYSIEQNKKIAAQDNLLLQQGAMLLELKKQLDELKATKK